MYNIYDIDECKQMNFLVYHDYFIYNLSTNVSHTC